MKRVGILVLLALLSGGTLLAQRYRGGGRGYGGGNWGGGGYGGGEGWLPEDAPVRTAREVPRHSYDMPEWTNTAGFGKDVFTFVRVQYHRGYKPNGARRAGYCFTDFPDSDLNLSYRLQQLTSLKVDPDGRVLRLTDPELFKYAFIYMVEPGAMEFSEEEVTALRQYLLSGGFLMADDFWGPKEWENFEDEIKRALPERNFSFKELQQDHPIFNCVFQLKISPDKRELQTPNYRQGELSETDIAEDGRHRTWEYHDGEECREMHVRAITDDAGRIMVIACHNTDNGDGWEREQENGYFFREFSEKRAYPLGINIIVYAMTH
ncbi:MAG TPA: DUF4159 domain-containing protein [Verrucomicrobiae bacterium]|jgi:hypothetical protein|nr:DUF4159 domain-containing protein [Verrucomicrobiae bacterium]